MVGKDRGSDRDREDQIRTVMELGIARSQIITMSASRKAPAILLETQRREPNNKQTNDRSTTA